jgi:RHH-type proline utilization regulon transcriptional repressor/proline dehydrogenase/delta 1-pyrroline-5-carboxylate dehydrogenase
VVRLHPGDSLFDVLARIAAARVAGCKVTVSVPEGMDTPAVRFLEEIEGKRLLEDTEVRHESDAALIAALPGIARVRFAAPERVPAALFEAAAAVGFYVARDPVLMDGRVELLHYFQNQSVCDTYHRYGNLGERSVL